MTYLIIGQDTQAKDLKITEIKNKYLKSEKSYEFDLDIFHAAKLDSDLLQQSFVALPAVAGYRVVIVRTADKLSTHNKELVLAQMVEKKSQTVVVLECDQLDGKTSFYKKLKKDAEVVRVRSDLKTNIFDMTNAMERRDGVQALKVLTQAMDEGQHPLQIMGVLVWFWGKMKTRLKDDTFKKGLLELQEADLNIKRSRIRSDYAVEIAVTKLCSLISC